MGGRGAGSGIGAFKDWLSNEGNGRGTVKPIDITQYQGQTLQQIEGRIRTLGHEELFALDKDGKIIAAYKGNAKSVGFPASLKDVKDATVTHGHPKGAEEFGGTFSFADVKNMIQSNWAEHRATASGQGEMNYIMRRTSSADGKGLYNQINKDYVKLNKSLETTYKAAYTKSINAGSSVSQARHVARQESVGELNKYWKNTMPKYGFEYITRKTSYEYGR